MEANRDVPKLLAAPAAVRFLSIEPVLGPVDLNWRGLRALGHVHDEHCSVPCHHRPGGGVDWVIVGGESGPQARPTNVDWIRSIVRQCRAAQVPAFVKQLGARAVTTNMFDLPTTWAPDMDEPITLDMRDPKGGDTDEWPEDLRVREFPR